MKVKNNRIKGLIFVISGPSGSGKTTLAERLLESRGLQKKLVKSVSFTTRPCRSAEKPGQDYFFITRNEFMERRQAKKILEWTRYLGYYYGTPKDFVEEQLARSKNVLLCLDLKGARQIKRVFPKNTVTIFVVPPSLATLRNRIEGRCSKTKKKEIGKRSKLAKEELRASKQYDYSLVNSNLERAVKELKTIILQKTGD